MPAPRAASSCCTPRRWPGNPYDGHTFGEVINSTETLTGCGIERAYVDKSYRGLETVTRAASSSRARSVASSG